MPTKHTTEQEVLREIEDAIQKEEVAIPIYASHIKAAMFLVRPSGRETSQNQSRFRNIAQRIPWACISIARGQKNL